MFHLVLLAPEIPHNAGAAGRLCLATGSTLHLVKPLGFSLDDKRTSQPDKSDLADILARWQKRKAEAKRARTDQSFLVPKAEIAENDYDLSINRYKEVIYEVVEYDPPKVILERLVKLEEEIAKGRAELEGLLK